MATKPPFVLVDDARSGGSGPAHLFEAPLALFIARRPEEVSETLEAAEQARKASGKPLAGYIAYEAGLALEPKLFGRAAARSGSAGPLVWLGLFEQQRLLCANELGTWLDAQGAGEASLGPLEPVLAPGDYARAFDRLQEAIRDGDIYQANLTFPLVGSWRGDPVALYRSIRPSAAAGHGALVHDGSHWLLSFSPELLASVGGKELRLKPMKGTRPRGQDMAGDLALAHELAVSTKDRAENLMIVDLMRNDVSRVAQAGSVRVADAFAIESFPTVHQMVTSISATLAQGKGATDLVRALFPCGSVTGAPKIRAMELIDEVEPGPRGIYCGAIGFIDGSGDSAFNVAIRTLRLSPGENGQGRAVLGVGSAIVADSRMMPEWRECLVKGGFVRQSSPDIRAAGFDLIETMAFDPEQGIPLLELHLERMKASAAELGFAFDRHATRNQIHALCFELEKPAKLRLVLARGGAIALEGGPMPDAKPLTRCAVLPLPVDEGDWRLRHKTTDRTFYDAARKVAQDAGADEALLIRDDGLLTEGSFTSIFVERDGKLLTPPTRLGLQPGVLRRSLIEADRVQEAELQMEDLAGGFLVGNALRGLMKAELI